MAGHTPLMFWIVVALVAGAFVGSFGNVVIYRAPLGLSVATPRSFCPSCHRQLTWWENVPVASWVGLRGRCRTCKTPISWRYPLVELAVGVAFCLVTWRWDASATSVPFCLLAATAIVVALIEYGGQRAPLVVAAIGALTGVAGLFGAGLWHHDTRLLWLPSVATFVALVLVSAMRTLDPDCRDPRWWGRSLIVVAGCWISGLPVSSVLFGVVVALVLFLAAMTLAWSIRRSRQPGGFVSAPFVTAALGGLAASLLYGSIWH